jgi:hypothetical protein
MQQLRAAGLSYQAIAEALAAAGSLTARGGRWQATTVRRLLYQHPASPKRREA